MKILHTADWHLNARLGRISRQKHIAARLREIAGYLEEHDVDVMLIAGDLFDHSMRHEELETAFRDIHEIFKPFLLKGGTILALSGNHDTEALFSILRMTADLAFPIDTDKPGPRPRGRLYLAPRPSVILLEDKQGLPIQFVLMPYPRPEGYLDGNRSFRSLEERNQLLQQQFAARLQDIQARPASFDKTLRSVLVTHVYIRGIEINPESRRELSEAEDVPFNVSDIPTHWDYVACGHVHRAQVIGGMSHVRYAGSVERLDAGERTDEKSVVLLEIGLSGMVAAPRLLPLRATPIYHVELADPETQITHIEEQYPDHTEAIVSCHLTYSPGSAFSRAQLIQELERVFPQIYRMELTDAANTSSTTRMENGAILSDVPGTVMRYLESQLKDDSSRDDILGLAAELLAAHGGVQ